MLKSILVLIALVGVAGLLYVRLAPLPTDQIGAQVGPTTPGTHPETGGFKVVLTLDDPQQGLTSLRDIALATPRTRALTAPDAAAVSLVTRSRVWGFPDITTLWVQDGQLHIRGHLVIGRSDLGVNQQRIEGWLRAAGITS